jgi:hypothetical protein
LERRMNNVCEFDNQSERHDARLVVDLMYGCSKEKASQNRADRSRLKYQVELTYHIMGKSCVGVCVSKCEVG